MPKTNPSAPPALTLLDDYTLLPATSLLADLFAAIAFAFCLGRLVDLIRGGRQQITAVCS